ncbi:MAG TPA: bifunctional adenosylcobinamide kinase/adenosylcobinamide-phosphate guanylyltransferase [Bryobacteraceae bacterium]|jgi:adenosylcobinamide kinase/adenosylcobinamide-phosphate guanylyltransferase|nr:bifunctional adenosylcobinamide kinase/adenosylcobinamide-phosphate guanylyltransferase [Bryobacteraceae bacterium]
MLTLVTGGARSGKSRFAENLGREASRPVYIATARPEDAEMAARIARHRQDRPAHWVTVEEPLEIAAALESQAHGSDFLLLDCLTLWLSNLCAAHAQEGDCLESAARAEIARLALASAGTHLVLVTNEVGSGIVPESRIARLFRDLQGRVNQEAARAADSVWLLVAGIPVAIKGGRA